MLKKSYNKINQFGVWLSDRIAEFGGSWTFIIFFFVVLTIWILLNLWLTKPFDAYPFILLNLFLSGLAGFQAPFIMMSNNRQNLKDRIRSEEDFRVDEDTNLRLRRIEKDLEEIKILIKEGK